MQLLHPMQRPASCSVRPFSSLCIALVGQTRAHAASVQWLHIVGVYSWRTFGNVPVSSMRWWDQNRPVSTLFSFLQAIWHAPQPTHLCRSITIP